MSRRWLAVRIWVAAWLIWPRVQALEKITAVSDQNLNLNTQSGPVCVPYQLNDESESLFGALRLSEHSVVLLILLLLIMANTKGKKYAS